MTQTFNPSLFPFHDPIAVRWSDFDMLGHANNSIYSTYLETARIHYLEAVGPWPWDVTGMVLARTVMDFLHEMLPTHTPHMYMRVSRLGNKSLDFESIIAEKDDPSLVFNKATVTVVAFDKDNKATVAIPQEMREKFTAFEPGLSE